MRLKLQYETDKNIIISDRVKEDFQGCKLYGCDVCWTCKWFDVESNICRPRAAGYPMRNNRIIRPEVYRCSFWGEIWYDE